MIRIVQRAIKASFATFGLLAIACGDGTSPTALGSGKPTNTTTSAAQVPGQNAAGPTLDQEWADIAQTQAPGFAGYYLDPADGTPVVRVVSPARNGDAAQRYVATRVFVSGTDRAVAARRPAAVRPAAYDFAQLTGWGQALVAELQTRADAFSLDVDEVNNRVAVSVSTPAAAATLQSAAARLGVPDSALAVTVEPPIRPESANTHLQAVAADIWGGFEIDITPNAGGGECTLGFNAIRQGVSGFVTNSHCSAEQNSLDYASTWQPATERGGSAIGYELYDIGYRNCSGSFVYQPCRDADASFFAHNGSRNVNLGRIARTEYRGVSGSPYPGSLDINPDPNNQAFAITAKLTSNGNLPVGTEVHKIGRTTGWTVGQVTATCVYTNNLRCQFRANYYSEPGDSGSPVFVPQGVLFTDAVTLVGIHWGSSGPNNKVFSSYPGIAFDLGALTICVDPYFGC